MEQEMTTTETNTPAAYDLDAFGSGPLATDDIVIPKVLIMQGLSKQVADGKAKLGDLVDSLSGEVIGNIEDAPLEFVPFHLEKVWIVSEKKGNRYFFSHIEPVTAINENKKWEEVVDGKEMKNEKSFNFYAILPSDPSIPYVIQFKSTSLKAGKELATQMFVKNRAAGKVPPAKVMALAGTKVSNDKGTFAVTKTNIVRDSEAGEIGTCLEWYTTIKGGAAKVHDDSAPASSEQPQF